MTDAPSKKIHADPTKDFFVDMITRDIALSDCIFDLVDNSVDGARKVAEENNQSSSKSFSGYTVDIIFNRNQFRIADNCGGISLSDAIDYAFHFGRRHDSPIDAKGSIGLYGIGMKRALFKIGSKATIKSETEEDSYEVLIDVPAWKNQTDWDFDYQDKEQSGAPGTEICVTNIHPSIANSFADPSFETELIKSMSRDYAFFVKNGLSVKINNKEIPQYDYTLKQSDDIKPGVEIYEDEGVKVTLKAGIMDELREEIPDELRPDKVDRFGWFVICNDRVVLAADKSEKTIWGDANYKVWHPQYNGFAGLAFFESDDPKKLPWTTTKRAVDSSDPLYRRALAKMKRLTDVFSSYSNERKGSPDTYKKSEQSAKSVAVDDLQQSMEMSFPKNKTVQPARKYVTISYRKPRDEVGQIKEHLSSTALSAKDVGIYTFEYYRKEELGDFEE